MESVLERRAGDFSVIDSTDAKSSIEDGKTAVRPFDPISDFLRRLSLAQSLLKGRNSRIWHTGEQTHERLSGTDGLIFLTEFKLWANADINLICES